MSNPLLYWYYFHGYLFNKVRYYDDGCNTEGHIFLRVPSVKDSSIVASERSHQKDHGWYEISDVKGYLSCGNRKTAV